MRLIGLDLEKYGAFEGRSLTFRPDARLHVVHGPNEAGKSSALAAVTDLLFGFGVRTDYAFRHAMADLRLGATIRTKDGCEATFRRRKGTRATLIGANEAALDDGLLTPFLGGLTREVFERAFGLGAGSMRKGAEELLSADGESGASLFAAASGLRGVEDLRRAMEAEADALFSPQARTRPFNELFRRHESARKSLHEAELGAGAWKKLTDEIDELERRRRELDDLRAKTKTAGARIERLQLAQSAAAAVERSRRLLADYADAPDLAPETAAELSTRLKQAEDAAKARVRASEAFRLAAATLASVEVDETALQAGGEIERLYRDSGAFAGYEKDLPRVQREADGLNEALARLAVRLGLGGGRSVADALPSDAARETLRDLLVEGRARAFSRESRDRLQAEEGERLAGLKAKAGNASAIDPGPLRAALAALAPRLRALNRQNDLRDERDREARAIAQAAARMSPPVSDVDRRAGRPLPAAEAITRARRERDANAAEIARVEQAIANDQADAARLDADAARLAAGAPIASAESIRAARDARDAAWEPLRAHLLGLSEREPARLIERAAAFERSVAEADRLADRLAEDAARFAQQAELERRRAETAARLGSLAARLAELERREAAAQEAWRALWAEADVAPGPPDQMDGWRKELLGLIERHDRNAERATVLAGLDAEELALAPELAQLADACGLDVKSGAGAVGLASAIEARLSSLDARWQESSALATQAAEVEGRLDRLARETASAAASEDAWRLQWAAALPAVGLRETESFAAVDAALSAWSEAPALIERRAALMQRIRGMGRETAAFREAVDRVVAALAAAELSGLPPQIAAERLSRRLTAARAAETRRADAASRASDARDANETATRAADEAERALAAASAGLPPGADLNVLLPRIDERARLKAGLAEKREQLLRLAGGLDEAALAAELEGFDPDAAPAEIERLELESRRLVGEGEQVWAELVAARARRDALGGAKAEAAAAEQRAAGAAMYAMAREWAVLKLAGLLLGSAVERARAADRSPVLDRAASLFGTLTGGGFSGFSEVYERDAPTLMGRRASGETVPLRGMSEGTRDQFYLALRLAFIEDYAARAEAPPFIGDDLMASFDDARTAHGLKALAEIGDKVQPILFTHHRSVVEIARATLGEAVDVVEL